MKQLLTSYFLLFVCLCANAQIGIKGDLHIHQGGSMMVNGSLQTTTDGIYNNDGTIALKGDWINNGHIWSINGGTTILSGSRRQLLNGASIIVFDSVEFDNALGFDLSGFNAIRYQGNFKQGILKSLDAIPFLIGDNATLLNVSDDSHVWGAVRKYGDDAFVFPIGDSLNYRPIKISSPSDAIDQFQAKYENGDPYSIGTLLHPVLDSINKIEYWDLQRPEGASNVYVAINYFYQPDNGLSDTLSNIAVTHYNGTLWDNLYNGGLGGLPNGVESTSPVDFFVPQFFTLGEQKGLVNGPLPIELLDFTALKDGNESSLHWHTSIEINADYFDVERSVDGEHWLHIRSIKAHGNSTAINAYELADLTPEKGNNYYRLKLIDFDRQFKYSDIRVVNFTQQNGETAHLYPNPTRDFSVLHGAGIAENSAYALYDAEGRKVLQAMLPEDQKVSVQNLPAGTYHLRYHAEDKEEVIDLVKQ